ncbi:MAG: SEC59/DGK1/VTE5 family protein [Pseudanabaenaceae cyanobacterium bins.39]|nr:SEC59/DGK1/VTE5 family protein [Pseudanabaenaceae cyanobacterium bins.39]
MFTTFSIDQSSLGLLGNLLPLLNQNLFSQTMAVCLWLGLVFAASEFLHRLRQDPELVRKVVHIGTGNVLVIAWWLHIPTWLCLSAGVIFSAIALVSHFINILPMLNDVGRKTYGVFYYSLSITLLVALFWQEHPQYAVIGVMVMSWGDGMAALIGKRFGKHIFMHLGNQRSIEGSLAMFVTSALVVMGVLGASQVEWSVGMMIALPVAAIASLLEAYSPGGTDNLSVPLASAFLSYFLNRFI